MANYNKSGVPWYSRGDTPAIRPAGAPEAPEPLPEEKIKKLGKAMAERQAIRDEIRSNWKSGDRFVLKMPEAHEDNKGAFDENHNLIDINRIVRWTTYTGTYLHMKFTGMGYSVMVNLDPPQKKAGGCFNTRTFLRWAQHADNPPSPESVSPS